MNNDLPQFRINIEGVGPVLVSPSRYSDAINVVSTDGGLLHTDGYLYSINFMLVERHEDFIPQAGCSVTTNRASCAVPKKIQTAIIYAVVEELRHHFVENPDTLLLVRNARRNIVSKSLEDAMARA